VSLDLVLETEKIAKGNTAGDGARHGPCGMLGGEDGKPHHYRLLSKAASARLRAKVGIELRPAIAWRYAPPAAAAGGRLQNDRRSAPTRPRAGLTDAPPEQASSGCSG
jgi:N-methylhydantoinase B